MNPLTACQRILLFKASEKQNSGQIFLPAVLFAFMHLHL